MLGIVGFSGVFGFVGMLLGNLLIVLMMGGIGELIFSDCVLVIIDSVYIWFIFGFNNLVV